RARESGGVSRAPSAQGATGEENVDALARARRGDTARKASTRGCLGRTVVLSGGRARLGETVWKQNATRAAARIHSLHARYHADHRIRGIRGASSRGTGTDLVACRGRD